MSVIDIQRSRERRAQKAQRRSALSTSISAPTGGWNARDALGAMPPEDAVTLENWFPTPSDVMMRMGMTQHATGLGASVYADTLMVYAGGSSNKLFAATSDGKIYDVSSSGAVGAAAVSGLGNGRWQYINVTTAAGSYLQAVNGVDAARYYTGAAWAKDGDGAPYDITGVSSTNLIHINVHKGRTWFVQSGTLKAWYLATGALGGAATSFDLSSVAQLGGYLMAMATWTIDAGQGVDDLAVWITSKGEVIVYEGTDPAYAGTWQLRGIWQIGSPVGRRCFMKYSGDLLVICQDGVQPLSGALQSSRVNPRVSLTDKIQSAMSEAVTSYGANFGWQLQQFPKSNQLYLNVPVQEGLNQQQFVMNTITKNWCNFTGWEACCWALYNDHIYFGAKSFVGKAWTGTSDNNANITANALQAFNYFGATGQLKRATMMRPVMLTDGTPTVSAGINFDFDLSDNTSTLSYSAIAYGTWDGSLWDAAIWGGGTLVQKLWQGARGTGYALAVNLKAVSAGLAVQWVSTDIVMEKGEVL